MSSEVVKGTFLQRLLLSINTHILCILKFDMFEFLAFICLCNKIQFEILNTAAHCITVIVNVKTDMVQN